MPVKGDLVLDGLGIDPQARQTLRKEVQLILNNAASINFDDPLRDALQINYYGSMRVLDLAHECENLLALHHVSTAGVNMNLPNHAVCPEEIVPFPHGIDWEKWVENISQMSP